jgi:hypothetical protein
MKCFARASVATGLACALACGDAATSSVSKSSATPRESELARVEIDKQPDSPQALIAKEPEKDSLVLPSMTHALDGEAPKFSLRIRAQGDTALVDNEPIASALRDDKSGRVRALLAAFDEEHKLDPGAGLELRSEVTLTARERRKGHLIDNLFDPLAAAIGIERTVASTVERPALQTAELAFDAGLPMTSVIDILYTAGVAEVRGYAVALMGPKGVQHAPIFSPGKTSCTDAERHGQCWTVTVGVTPQGTFLGVVRGTKPGRCGPGQYSPKLDDGDRYVLSTSDGSCPSAGLGGEAAAKVDALITEIAEKAPLCPTYYLGGKSTVTWRDVAPFFATLGRRGFVVFDRGTPAPTTCADSIQIQAFVPGSVPEP